MKTNPYDPTHAIVAHKRPNQTGGHYEVDTWYGMTKREYFSAMAMQGLYNGVHSDIRIHQAALCDTAKLQGVDMDNVDMENYVAYFSVKMADALINELNK